MPTATWLVEGEGMQYKLSLTSLNQSMAILRAPLNPPFPLFRELAAVALQCTVASTSS